MTIPNGERYTSSKTGVKSRVENYISAVDPIGEGERNKTLHNLGLLLRSNFGLTGNDIEAALSEVNATKCTPPLPECEVQTIARSVDTSDVPVGNGDNGTGMSPNRRKATKPPEKQYTIKVAETPVAVADIMEREVSVYQNCYANVPQKTVTIGRILDTIRTGGNSKEQILAIRNEPDKGKRDNMKKQLPAFVPGSEPQKERKKVACKPNGMLGLDFDSIPADELETAKEVIAAVPYVIVVGLSVSGKGYFALAEYEDTPDLKLLLAAIQADVPDYKIDTSCSDVSRLRYVTQDENLILKDEVYPAILTEQITAVPGTNGTIGTKKRDIIHTGVDVLDSILETIEPVDWCPDCDEDEGNEDNEDKGGKSKQPTERDYLLRTCDHVLETATTAGYPIVNRNGAIYYYANTHYRDATESELRNFLIGAAISCGVPNDTAIYQFFVNKLIRQFYINAGLVSSNVTEPDIAFINMRNGTLFFDKTGHRFEPHTSKHFIRYALDFDYNPAATAPRWQQHLDRTFPHPDKQAYLAKCLALPFYKGKIEKAPILFGKTDTGKSTTLDTFKALIGKENRSSETLAAVTRTDYTGDYARARLDGKLVNIASDISPKISDDGLAKTLISRETVSARRPHQEGFDMQGYARLVFAMNDLPPQFFTDAALTKRVAIIEFDQQIAPDKKDTDFAEKLIADERPGILNWIIGGLTQLIAVGRLDPPPCCVEAMDRIRKESDPLARWLEDQQYHVGSSCSIAVDVAYDRFSDYCKKNGNITPSNKTFCKRLRDAGYTVDRPNHATGMRLYYSVSFPKNDADDANDAGMVPPGTPENDGIRHERHERHEKLERNLDDQYTDTVDATDAALAGDYLSADSKYEDACNRSLHREEYACEYGSNSTASGEEVEAYCDNDYDHKMRDWMRRSSGRYR